MQILLAGVDFNQRAIGLAKLSDLGPACSEPVSLIHHYLMKFRLAPKFETIGFLTVEPLVDSFNWRDPDHSPSFTTKSGSM
jgi:hypothetical protein